MRLVTIRDSAWKVLAIEASGGKSAWDHLQEEADAGDRHAKKMMVILERAAMNGPRKDGNSSKQLKDGINEFRYGPARGAKIRVLYFYDRGRVIVCTHRFWKKDRDIQDEIERAKELRTRYLKAKQQNQIVIEDAGGDNEE